ncbi:ankyrin repeat domain-containing protein [Wolbachia endosymbiont of Listronotus oregonensis]|uniref:ankyrin repeat domain-containing protein n=1 Tax=Wolbachia endosymbiont of Listronotus oregonensis TaxID=2969106 RepID=UPI0028163850|nr:ankyrin repeat domain-containing protein [Wolbachia endosymbiont of Listronotus oregonensis]WMT83867.1 ankyrin repeat domain-containing protein [Wolbachia endosymbiont of Listronotus oregonensis]
MKCTPLHFAAKNGNVKAVERLLEFVNDKEGYVKHENSSKCTPLHFAARSGNVKVVEKLLEYVNDKEGYVKHENSNKCTPLHFAAWGSNVEVINKLLEFVGAEAKEGYVQSKNNKGETPLHFAAMSGNVKAVERLLQCVGEDEKENYIRFVNNDNENALDIAISYDSWEVFHELLKYIKNLEQSQYYLDLAKQASGSKKRNVYSLDDLQTKGRVEGRKKQRNKELITKKTHSHSEAVKDDNNPCSQSEGPTSSYSKKRPRISNGNTQKPPVKKVAQSDSSRQEVKIKSNVGNDESDEQQDSSRESGSEISGLLSSSSGSQEVEHTASNDISERSSGDGESVYSPPEQNSGSSLERGKGFWHTKICRVIEEGAENRIQLLRALIREGENPGHIGHSCSPLLEAAQKCDEEVVRFLVDECKVDVNIKESCSGKNAIFYAIKKNNTEIAEFLFSKGAKVDFYNFEDLVESAAIAGNVSILKTLVDNCTQARFFIYLDRFPLMEELDGLLNGHNLSHEIRDLLEQNRSKLCTPHPSYGQESDTEENNLRSGSQESSPETSDSQPNSPSFQEVEHTASNDISEKSFGDEESVYSSLEQNSSSSLERGKGSCSPISHDLDGTDKNYDSTLQQSNAESESLNNVQPDLNRNGNIPLHVAAQNGHLNVAGTRIDVGSFFKEVTPLFNALNIEMRSPKTTLNSVALDNQLRRRSASF